MARAEVRNASNPVRQIELRPATGTHKLSLRDYVGLAGGDPAMGEMLYRSANGEKPTCDGLSYDDE